MTEESSKFYFENAEFFKNKNIKMMEPAWKLVISSKSILPVLYALYPDNKYLLPSYFTCR